MKKYPYFCPATAPGNSCSPHWNGLQNSVRYKAVFFEIQKIWIDETMKLSPDADRGGQVPVETLDNCFIDSQFTIWPWQIMGSKVGQVRNFDKIRFDKID